MPQRNAGINLPRLGVTGSLNAPGVQPDLPAAPPQDFGQFVQGLAAFTGLAGSANQLSKTVHDQTVLDETDKAIEALMAGEQAPIFTTPQAQELFDRGQGYQLAIDTDVKLLN